MNAENMFQAYSASRVSFQRRLQLSIQGFLLIILLIAQQWILHEFEHHVLEAAAESARIVADGAINGLNTLMVTKVDDEEVIRNKKSRALFIKKMGSSENIKEMRIIRGPLVDREYPGGLSQEQPADEIDRRVLDTGKTEIADVDNGNALRTVVPFIAQKNFRGTNCLNCHEVDEGAILGAASVTIDIHETHEYLARINRWLWTGQILLQITLFFVIGAIVQRALAKLGGEPEYVISIVEQIARGDLSGQINLHSNDKTSLLAATRHMQDGLREMIQNSRQTAETLAHAAGGLSDSSRKMLKAAEAESKASAVVASSVQEITSYVGEISANAGQAKRYAEETRTLANEGSLVVQQVIAEIGQISVAVSGSSEQILTLGEKSREISSIVSVIKEIAEQTNLLALNAAIEAARAGEQGRGFAVVADEVRKLAERTTIATQQVTLMVEAIQTGTNGAVSGMSRGSELVHGGVALAGRSGNSMENIQSGAHKVLDAIGDISSSLQEHGTTSSRLADSIHEIVRMTDETRQVSQDVASSANELERLATLLKDVVRRFKL